MVKNKKNQCWHSLHIKTILEILRSSPNGLSKQDATERLAEYGPNILPEPKKQSPLIRFLLQFHNIFIYVLLGAAFITAILDHYIDMAVILAVVIINAIIGFIQEGKAEKAIAAIRHILALRAMVQRDNKIYRIKSENLVPGDIVLIEAGDKIPADLRLIHAHGLYIQEAILTGESIPVEKHTAPVEQNALISDQSCMAFSGTIVTSGQGKGVVVATGKNTEIGRISSMVAKVETLTTPLALQINIFAKWLTFLILLVAGLLFAFGYFVEHYKFDDIFMVVVGLSVAAIPEGLPAVLTITLAIGVQTMARRHAIVRRLPAIETLGAVSVICTDKTGTLTKNEMMVVSSATYQDVFEVNGFGYNPQGNIKKNENIIDPKNYPILYELGLISYLCNNASLNQNNGIWTVEGDPMEGALLAFAQKTGIDFSEINHEWNRIDVIPFDSKYRLMATLHHNHNGDAIISVKGAPEDLLSLCKNQRISSGDTSQLNKEYWISTSENIAAQGQRVLAFAFAKAKPEHFILKHDDLLNSLTFVGIVGIIDPPRQEAIRAIAECKAAGIDVKMITGDHAVTSQAIGKQIGLQHSQIVLTGKDLEVMGDNELKDAVLNCDIFARVSPKHKLRLVTALQANDMIVAMTGDGVNDAPALKRADVGIAMGKTGSEAAKESAEIILTDDNFASIAEAVKEGRTVYDNIKKVISWTLPTNSGEAMIIIFALLFSMTLPITPIQILWINMITAITLGITLAFEPTEKNTMRRPPRKKKAPLLGGELVWHIILVSILFICGVFGIYTYVIGKGYSIELARTIALNTLVVMEIFHLFFIRNIYGTSLTWKAVKGTKVVWAAVVTITIAQFSITYIPFLQKIFSTRSVPFYDGIIIVAIGIALFAIIEIEKQLRLKLKYMTNSNKGL